jgi:hypothetical protein
MSGKGSRPRPFSVDQNTFAANWDTIFRKSDPRVLEEAKLEDEDWQYIEMLNKLRQENDKKE